MMRSRLSSALLERHQALLAALGLGLALLLGFEVAELSARADGLLLEWAFQLRPASHPAGSVSLVVLNGTRASDPAPIREQVVQTLEALVAAQVEPAAVVVDVVLSSRAGECGSDQLEKRLVEATRRLRHVVHAAEGAWGHRMDSDRVGQFSPLEPHLLPGDRPWPPLPTLDGVGLAHPALAPDLYQAAAAVGSVSPSPAQREGASVLRMSLLARIFPLEDRQAPRTVLPSLALAGAGAALCGELSLERCLEPGSDGLRLAGHRIPNEPDGTLWVNYRRRFQVVPEAPGAPLEPRAAMAVPDVLVAAPSSSVQHPDSVAGSATSFWSLEGEPISPQRLNGRVLLLVNGREMRQMHTPLGTSWPQYTVHAQLLSNLLEQDFLRPVPRIWGLLGALGLLLVAVLARARGLGAQVPRLSGTPALFRPISLLGLELLWGPELCLALFFGVMGWLLFVLESIWMPPTGALLALMGCSIGWRTRIHTELELALTRRGQHLQELEALKQQLATQAQTLKELTEQLDNADSDAPSTEELRLLEQLLEESWTLVADRVPAATPTIASGEVLERLQQSRAALKRTLASVRSIESTLETEDSGMRTWAPMHQHWRDALSQAFSSLRDSLQVLAHSPGDLARPSTGEWSGHSGNPPLPSAEEASFGRIHTCDPALRALLLELKTRIAPDPHIAVLIQGESGTGKELVAEAIHDASPRSQMPYRTLSCGALHPDTLHSLLFGHKKGSFTGAIQDRKGIFEEADGGTVFLDELGELPLREQPVLLRLLENGEVLPMGENQVRKVDVRILAATHVDLEKAVKEGRFRQDLYQRIGELIVRLPPLRLRRCDSALLAHQLLGLEAALRSRALAFSFGALQVLEAQPWPGNVRELRNVIRRLVLLAEGPVITERDVRAQLSVQAHTGQSIRPETLELEPDLLRWLEEARASGFSASEQVEQFQISRKRADAHIRTLLAIALGLCQCDDQQVAHWMGGGDEALEARVLERLAIFRPTLEGYARKLRVDGRAPLLKSLRGDYGAYAPQVVELVARL